MEPDAIAALEEAAALLGQLPDDPEVQDALAHVQAAQRYLKARDERIAYQADQLAAEKAAATSHRS